MNQCFWKMKHFTENSKDCTNGCVRECRKNSDVARKIYHYTKNVEDYIMDTYRNSKLLLYIVYMTVEQFLYTGLFLDAW